MPRIFPFESSEPLHSTLNFLLFLNKTCSGLDLACTILSNACIMLLTERKPFWLWNTSKLDLINYTAYMPISTHSWPHNSISFRFRYNKSPRQTRYILFTVPAYGSNRQIILKQITNSTQSQVSECLQAHRCQQSTDEAFSLGAVQDCAHGFLNSFLSPIRVDSVLDLTCGVLSNARREILVWSTSKSYMPLIAWLRRILQPNPPEIY